MWTLNKHKIIIDILAADDLWETLKAMGTPVAIVVGLLIDERASAVEFPPIIDLFKIWCLESEAVWNFAYDKNYAIMFT